MPIIPILELETCQNAMKYVNCDVWHNPLQLDLQSEIQLW
jgi:hypothetical protein